MIYFEKGKVGISLDFFLDLFLILKCFVVRLFYRGFVR